MMALLPLNLIAAADTVQTAAARGADTASVVMLAMVIGGSSLVFLIISVLGLFITRREADRNHEDAVKRIAALEQRSVVTVDTWKETQARLDEQVSQLFSKLGGVERGGVQRMEEVRREITGQLSDLGARLGAVDRGLGEVQTEVRLLGKTIERVLAREEKS